LRKRWQTVGLAQQVRRQSVLGNCSGHRGRGTCRPVVTRLPQQNRHGDGRGTSRVSEVPTEPRTLVACGAGTGPSAINCCPECYAIFNTIPTGQWSEPITSGMMKAIDTDGTMFWETKM